MIQIARSSTPSCSTCYVNATFVPWRASLPCLYTNPLEFACSPPTQLLDRLRRDARQPRVRMPAPQSRGGDRRLRRTPIWPRPGRPLPNRQMRGFRVPSPTPERPVPRRSAVGPAGSPPNRPPAREAGHQVLSSSAAPAGGGPSCSNAATVHCVTASSSPHACTNATAAGPAPSPN